MSPRTQVTLLVYSGTGRSTCSPSEVFSRLHPHLSAKLETCLPPAAAGLLGCSVGTPVIFSIHKISLHPSQPFVHMGPSVLSCHPDGRAQWSSGGFASSHAELLVAYGACGCPKLCSGLLCPHPGQETDAEAAGSLAAITNA